MKLSLQTGTMEVFMFLPMFGIIWDSDIRTLESGIYFLKYFITINIKL